MLPLIMLPHNSRLLTGQRYTLSFFGRDNDKYVAISDKFFKEVKTNPLFTSYVFPLVSADGTVIATRGAWVLVDNG